MSGAIEIAGCVEEQKKVAPSDAKPELSSPPNFSRRITELDGDRGMAVALALSFHYMSSLAIISYERQALQPFTAMQANQIGVVDVIPILGLKMRVIQHQLPPGLHPSVYKRLRPRLLQAMSS